MATGKRTQGRALQVEVPEVLAKRLDDLLAQTRRTPAQELLLALEFWLDRQGVGESAVEPPAPRTTPAVPPSGQLERQAGDRPARRRPPTP
jgi:hypothetical protein